MAFVVMTENLKALIQKKKYTFDVNRRTTISGFQ